MRNIINKILKESEFDWLPDQGEIGLKVRVNEKPFHIKNPVHRQDEGIFKSRCSWLGCYEIVGEEIFTGIDCYIIKLDDHYPEVYFPKKAFLEKDFCGIDDTGNRLFESEKDDFGWANEIINEDPIKVGDVFYIVDTNFGVGIEHPIDYRPENVRYIFFVTKIYKRNGDFRVEYKHCNNQGISYDPRDFNPTQPRCHYGDIDTIKYKDALNLVNEKYWRPIGNNGYHLSPPLNESEDDFGWAENLVTEPFHYQLMRDNPRKPVRLEDVKYIMFNPPVEVGDKRFNKIAYFLEDNDYYPDTLESFGKKTSYIEITKWIKRTINVRQNGRWNIGPELSEQELYNFSQTENNGKYWAEEFIFVDNDGNPFEF